MVHPGTLIARSGAGWQTRASPAARYHPVDVRAGLRCLVSIALSLLGVLICGTIGGVAAWAIVGAAGITGIAGALLAAVLGMVMAVAAWVAGTSLLRVLTGRR
jgi:hypothetical protein